MSEEHDMALLREAYGQTDFETIETTPESEAPTATAAMFSIRGELTKSAVAIESRLHDNREFPLVASYSRGSGGDDDLYVSATVIDQETGERLMTKLDQKRVRVFPKGELSFEAFCRYVSYLQERLRVDLDLERRDNDE